MNPGNSMIALDTNVVARYLLDDIPDHSTRTWIGSPASPASNPDAVANLLPSFGCLMDCDDLDGPAMSQLRAQCYMCFRFCRMYDARPMSHT